MIIDLGSFAFGSSLQNGTGTPSWGTAVGQSRPEYKITREGADRLIMGMVYCSVPTKYVKMPVGKGGKVLSGTETDAFKLAAVFHKVYVNNVKIDYPFVLILDKEESESHPGRLSIRYSDKIIYQDGEEFYGNATFIKKVREAFEMSEEACWFAYDIDVKKQDTLLISIAVVNPDEKETYLNSEVRKKKWQQLIPDLDIEQLGVQTGTGAVYNLDCSEYINLLKNKHNLVLTGAPGTGKTWLSKAIASKMGAVTQFVQFHPSYDYTDFVEGLRPTPPDEDGSNASAGVSFERLDGIFKKFCKEALLSLRDEETKNTPYVFIIDEINPIPNSTYYTLTLREVESRRIYYKDVAFKESDVFNHPDGTIEEDFFGYIFGIGEGEARSTSKETRAAIREGRVIIGMSKDEVQLAMGEPFNMTKDNGQDLWMYARSNGVILDVWFSSKGKVTKVKARATKNTKSKTVNPTTPKEADDMQRNGGTWTQGTPVE